MSFLEAECQVITKDLPAFYQDILTFFIKITWGIAFYCDSVSHQQLIFTQCFSIVRFSRLVGICIKGKIVIKILFIYTFSPLNFSKRIFRR